MYNVANPAPGSPGPGDQGWPCPVARHRPSQWEEDWGDSGQGFFDVHHKCCVREHDGPDFEAHIYMCFFVTNLPQHLSLFAI